MKLVQNFFVTSAANPCLEVGNKQIPIRGRDLNFEGITFDLEMWGRYGTI